MSFKIGIVGLGYVGGAVLNAYTLKNRKVHTFDVNPVTNPSCKSLQELVELVDLIYVAVPTPMKSTGECDTSIVESVVNDICKHETPKIIVIKSTVPPKTTEKLQHANLSHSIMFNPEFLTEANYKNDYLHQDVMLVGFCGWVWQDLAFDVLKEIKSTINSVKYSATVNATEAEFYKYLCNTFLATKVSFANEMETLASKLNVNWDTMRNAITVDARMGTSHWQVPGPDGHNGFGGTCVLPTTPVITPDGTVEIQNLSSGNVVASTNELINLEDIKIINSVVEREYSGEMYEFETEVGVLTCTPDHLIPVVRTGVTLLIPAKDVRLTDSVYTYIKG